MVVIVIGVCGCGKTTVGRILAGKLGVPFYDADDFHSEANVEKMRSGIPLDDEDRAPWLSRLADEIVCWEETGGAVLACAGQTDAYRKTLRSKAENVRFVYMKGSRELLWNRMKKRKGHYMAVSLLDKQLALFEEPENAITVDAAHTPEEIVEAILEQF